MVWEKRCSIVADVSMWSFNVRRFSHSTNCCYAIVQLGFKLVLQIHDEVILEGPEGFAEEAMEQVKRVMAYPLEQELDVDLNVDANYAKTWYDAK